MAPVYEEVAAYFEDSDRVVIAKMDATENDIPHKDVKVEGFPTIILFTEDGRAPIPFNGARTKDALVDFVNSNLEKTEL